MPPGVHADPALPGEPATATAPDTVVALVADIHGNLAALEAVTADIERRGITRVANLGDCLSGPLLPRETAAFLMARDWPTVAGNHERQILYPGPGGRMPSDAWAFAQLGPAELAWLQSLSPTLGLAPGILLCHGTPASDIQYLLHTLTPDGTVREASAREIARRLKSDPTPIPTPTLIACGHTHLARSVRTREGPWVVNPGSVGLPAYADTHPVPHVMAAGSPDARYAIVERRDGDWRVSLLTIPYDVEPMARLAERHDRPDWAHALRTGTMPHGF